jgi:hypothetical protein
VVLLDWSWRLTVVRVRPAGSGSAGCVLCGRGGVVVRVGQGWCSTLVSSELSAALQLPRSRLTFDGAPLVCGCRPRAHIGVHPAGHAQGSPVAGSQTMAGPGCCLTVTLMPGVSVELRWFHTGPVPGAAVSFVGGSAQVRADRYVVLGPDRAVKIRDVGSGRERLEVKVRQCSELVTTPVAGWCEWWRKFPALHPTVDGPGLTVHKRRWRNGGIEVVELDHGRAWTVAVRLDPERRLLDRLAGAPFAELLAPERSMGYPAFLAPANPS